MATDEDLSQIKDSNVNCDTESTVNCDVKEEESHSSMKYVPFNSHRLRRPSLRAKFGKLMHQPSMHEGEV